MNNHTSKALSTSPAKSSSPSSSISTTKTTDSAEVLRLQKEIARLQNQFKKQACLHHGQSSAFQETTLSEPSPNNGSAVCPKRCCSSAERSGSPGVDSVVDQQASDRVEGWKVASVTPFPCLRSPNPIVRPSPESFSSARALADALEKDYNLGSFKYHSSKQEHEADGGQVSKTRDTQVEEEIVGQWIPTDEFSENSSEGRSDRIFRLLDTLANRKKSNNITKVAPKWVSHTANDLLREFWGLICSNKLMRHRYVRARSVIARIHQMYVKAKETLVNERRESSTEKAELQASKKLDAKLLQQDLLSELVELRIRVQGLEQEIVDHKNEADAWRKQAQNNLEQLANADLDKFQTLRTRMEEAVAKSRRFEMRDDIWSDLTQTLQTAVAVLSSSLSSDEEKEKQKRALESKVISCSIAMRELQIKGEQEENGSQEWKPSELERLLEESLEGVRSQLEEARRGWKECLEQSESWRHQYQQQAEELGRLRSEREADVDRHRLMRLEIDRLITSEAHLESRLLQLEDPEHPLKVANLAQVERLQHEVEALRIMNASLNHEEMVKRVSVPYALAAQRADRENQNINRRVHYL